MKISEKNKIRGIVLAGVHKNDRDKVEIAEILKYWEIKRIAKSSNKIRVEFTKQGANPKLTKTRIDIMNANIDLFTPGEVALILGDS